MVAAKGVADFQVRCLAREFEVLGLQRVGISSDQAPAVLEQVPAEKAARAAEAVLASGPKKDTASKGRIENVVWIVEDVLRAIVR